MRRPLLLVSLSLMVTCFLLDPVHAQPYAPPSGYNPTGGPPPPPPYRGRSGPYARGPSPNPENCGTPDAPKPCPPMPRVPLQYYPANRP